MQANAIQYLLVASVFQTMDKHFHSAVTDEAYPHDRKDEIS